MSVSRFWRAEFLFHVKYITSYSYIEIEYVATSFSPARTDLAVKLLMSAAVTSLTIGTEMLVVVFDK